MRFNPSLCAVLVSMASLFAVGCTPENPLGRKALTAKVMFDGQPLSSGTISFEPDAEGGVTSGGVITNGEFSVAAEQGLPPGLYRVRINASAGGEQSSDLLPGAPGEVAKELIPAKWNRRSEEFVEVTADGENAFTFEIES